MEPHGRSLEYLMESLGSILKVPHGIFFWQTLGRILGQTLGQKPLGPAAPRVFGRGFGLGYGLGLAFRKSLGGPSIYSLGTPLSTLGNLPRGSIHHYTPSAFPQIVPLCRHQEDSCEIQLEKPPRVNILEMGLSSL